VWLVAEAVLVDAVADQGKDLAVWLVADARLGEVVAGQREGFGSLPSGRRSSCCGGSRPRKGFGGLLVADAALGEVVAGQGQAFAVCLVAGAARGGGGSRL
jgi:hypothetical protein